MAKTGATTKQINNKSFQIKDLARNQNASTKKKWASAHLLVFATR
jgi:hypothetical protein